MKRFILFLTLFLFIIPALKLSAQINPPKGKCLVLANPSDSGMFAVFASVLGILSFYENNQKHYPGLAVVLDSGRYLDLHKGKNWWEYFFEPIAMGNLKASKHYISLNEYLKLVPQIADRRRAADLIKKYVRVKPHIQADVDNYVRENFQGHYVIGIHHRGTDKVLETAIVPYAKTYSVLNDVIKKLHPNDLSRLRVYVATDDQHFLNYLVEKMPSIVIYSDFVRSSTSAAIHNSAELYDSNYQMGYEALIDCLLLSRCNFLIRPASSTLSMASMCFNPQLDTLSLRGD
jgi:hypothetical protein